jgi:hypothetical protein
MTLFKKIEGQNCQNRMEDVRQTVAYNQQFVYDYEHGFTYQHQLMREEVSILSGFDLPHSCTNNTKQ